MMKKGTYNKIKIILVLSIILSFLQCEKDQDLSCNEVLQGDFVLVE
jgi:hypothetical protein